MQRRTTHRQTTALLLHLFMVTGVVLSLLYGCLDSIGIQWNRHAQQQFIRELPERSPLFIVLEMSESGFGQMQRINEHECVIDDQFYDIVSIVHAPKGITLTLLPDSKETSLRKNIGEKMAASSHSSQSQKWPPSGFLFFENRTMPVSYESMLEETPNMTYACYAPDPMLSIHLPPPRLKHADRFPFTF